MQRIPMILPQRSSRAPAQGPEVAGQRQFSGVRQGSGSVEIGSNARF